jgi:hypothetical protein
MFVADPDLEFLPIPDPGAKKAPDPGAKKAPDRGWIRNTGYRTIFLGIKIDLSETLTETETETDYRYVLLEFTAVLFPKLVLIWEPVQ